MGDFSIFTHRRFVKSPGCKFSIHGLTPSYTTTPVARIAETGRTVTWSRALTYRPRRGHRNPTHRPFERKLKTTPPFARTAGFVILIVSNNMVVDKVKYRNLILYLAKNLGGEIRGKKKLAKLLYFVDFDFFEKYERSISGDTYKALPMGPFPSHLTDLLDEMKQNGELVKDAVEEWTGLEPTEVYSLQKDPDLSVFSKEERQMIERVALKYGSLNGKQLQDLSHAEAPYIGTHPNEVIAYELAFYRETDLNGI